MVHPDLMHHALQTLIGGGITGIGWFIKYLFGRLVDEWKDTKSTLLAIQQTTQVQAENHLKTIEANTGETNKILGQMVAGQAEMNGFLRGRLG